jgi:hypothetical protein
MAFYVDGDSSTPNPTLEVKAGERVRVVLRNEDRGMTHDLAVPAVAAAMDAIRWDESGEVTFDAPDTPGTYEYVCRPHALMMRGIIRVYRRVGRLISPLTRPRCRPSLSGPRANPVAPDKKFRNSSGRKLHVRSTMPAFQAF